MDMHWLEVKYIGLVSNRLRNFKRKSGDLINFSCPICGDSDSDTKKARGYIYSKQGKTKFHCHNCGITNSFQTFLKQLDYQLFSEFSIEKLKENKSAEQIELEQFVAKLRTPLFIKSGPLKGLKKVSQLSPTDPIKLLVESRKIPTKYHAKLFKCSAFFSFTNNLIPGKFDEEALLYDETRLLIPFIDRDQHVHAYQGRSLDPKSKSRYITIVYDDTKPKIWGLDDVDFAQKTYVFEGPIDAMFVSNSIATAGGDVVATVATLPRDKLVIVMDNEPRSKETKQKLEKAIINGYNVCIWPSNLEYKDVNDMVKDGGLSQDFVRYIIDTNTHRDLKAKLALNNWSKV